MASLNLSGVGASKMHVPIMCGIIEICSVPHPSTISMLKLTSIIARVVMFNISQHSQVMSPAWECFFYPLFKMTSSLHVKNTKRMKGTQRLYNDKCTTFQHSISGLLYRNNNLWRLVNENIICFNYVKTHKKDNEFHTSFFCIEIDFSLEETGYFDVWLEETYKVCAWYKNPFKLCFRINL